MLGYIIFVIALLLSQSFKNEKRRLFYLFFVITVFSSIRYGIAYDYYMYLETAMGARSTYGIEFIPRIMLEFSSESIPFLFFVFSSIFISLFFYLGIKQGGRYCFEEVLLYVVFPFLFIDHLGIIRQGMATAVVFLAIVIDEKKIILRLLLIAIAFLCHQSAIVGVFILFPWERIKSSLLWVIFLASFILSPVIISITSMIVGSGIGGEMLTSRASEYLESSSDVEGNLLKYFMFFIVLVILGNYKRLVALDKKNAYYIGLIVLGIAFFSIFSFHISMGKRFCMFFYTPIIFIIPQLFRIYKIPKQVYTLICIVLFALTIFIGSSTTRDEDPPGYSVTYPYRTIFQFLQD